MSRFFLFFLFIVSLPCAALPDEQAIPAVQVYDLSVSIDVSASRISGLASMNVQSGRDVVLAVGKLAILQVTLNERKIDTESRDGLISIKPRESGTLSIRYEGVYRDTGYGRDTTDGADRNTIDAKGISLTGTWYPKPQELSRYQLKVTLPPGYEALSEADRVEKRIRGDRLEFLFHFDHPLEGVSLIASDRFEVIQDRVNDVDLYAFFFPEDRGLARSYLQHVRKSIELHEKLLVRYPYKRFSIAENFLPIGESRPTFALLGQDVVRLPSIPETDLDHEILRQWFGCSVYIDAPEGNWAEGLTTYLADHLPEEQNGKGWEYRKQRLVDYDASVNSKNEISLREFTKRTDHASEAVGCGKGAMVFHTLKILLGEDQFYSALREFVSQNQYKQVSWDAIRLAFEKQSGKDLVPFFRQWVDERGLPDLRIEKASVKRNGDLFEVSFDVLQKGKNYALDLPVVVSSQRGSTKKETFSFDGERKTFTVLTDFEPQTMIIDGDYDVARKLTDAETPPVIAALLGDEHPLIVLPVADREAYTPVIASLKMRGAAEKEADDLKDSETKSSSLAILGDENPLLRRLFGKAESGKAGFSLTARKNPWNERKVAVTMNARSASEAEAAFSKIPSYGAYSVLAFDEGRNISKKIGDSQRGIIIELREQTAAIDLSMPKTLSDVIEGATGKKIVYIGEYHDRFSNHNVELEIIKSFSQKGMKVAVGMEMFQRPFQKTLDEYIAGAIDEREFLKSTEYFKRWGFDYNLYKPILDFVRAEKIPVVALNLRREIIEKVSKEGMDSLSQEEKKEIPPAMDFSDDKYRDRLKDIFDQHKGSEERNFEFFYQCQILWDETMAMSIDEYLKKSPDYCMVVLAGGGHVSYGSGIPKRAFRRNGFPYTIILNDGDLEKDIANYIVFPQPLDGVTAPKIMAFLDEKGGKITITGFPKDSVSEKAGLKVGDTIISLDGMPVRSVEDIKLFLFYKKKEEPLRVNVVRKRFLLGERTMEFEVHL